MQDSIYFSAFLTQDKIETHIVYNIKDTIDALPWNSMDPYKGKIIEN